MLSDKATRALRPDPDRPGTKHHDRDSLSLWVACSGSKTWHKDSRWPGARRTFTLAAADEPAGSGQLPSQERALAQHGMAPAGPQAGSVNQAIPVFYSP